MTKQETESVFLIRQQAIHFVSPEMNEAAALAMQRFGEFVDYLAAIDPGLERHESILLAGAIVKGLPALFKNNPELIDHIKEDCEVIKLKRQSPIANPQ